MFRPQTQSNQTERRNLAVGREILIGLKFLHRVNGIRAPVAIHLAFEVALIRQRLLDFPIALRRGLHLPANRRSSNNLGLGFRRSLVLLGRQRYRPQRDNQKEVAQTSSLEHFKGTHGMTAMALIAP